MFKSSVLLILFLFSVANCQFFYNYEEDRSDGPQTQNYDPSAYQYNSPSAVNQQFAQPNRNEAEPPNETGQRRARIRVRSRNYQSETDYNEPQQQPNYVPATQPENDQHAVRQERRQERRRQRQRYFVQPTSPPRIYSPSVFENIELGEAPGGIYIPHNSFLNVLKNPSPRAPSHSVSQPQAAVPQNTNYVQPPVNYVNNEPQPTFFVQPPSNEEPRQPNLILPVTRSQNEYAIPTSSQQIRENRGSISQNAPVHVVRINRRSRQRVRPQPEYAPPTADIDSYRQYTDEVSREDIQIMPQVEYAPVTVHQEGRSQNRRRKVTSYQESTPAPRVYSPSVFEKVSLGEAPSGIYVPEDSLLNILRNPSAARPVASRVSRRESQELQVQPTYSASNDYVPEVVEEEPYYHLPPPPPPGRRSSQRSRQLLSSRRSEHQAHQNEYEDQTVVQPVQSPSPRRTQRRNENYEDFSRLKPPAQQQAHQNTYEDQTAVQPVQSPSPRRTQRRNENYDDFSRLKPPAQQQAHQNEYEEQTAVQPVQSPSPRRSQRRNENYDDFSRQRPPAQQHAQSQRRPAPAPRQQTQVSTSEREQPSSRKAKLAIAALPLDTDDDGIPGEAGVDYPTLHRIPKTTFSCAQQPYGGYYADLETSCQVVHLCQSGGVQNSFLCPNGTIFSQEKFSCQWWYKVNCSDSPNFYIKNDELYKVPEKKESKRN